MDGIDQDLLNQFSCMGTTDRDELIKQFQLLVDNQISSHVASFFLEMNNWNIHGAIGSYFDINQNKLYVQFCDQTKTENVLPGTRFTKVLKLCNAGYEPWPTDCFILIQGRRDKPNLTPAVDRIPLPSIQPGSFAEIQIDFTAPSCDCVCYCHLNCFTSNGILFGNCVLMVNVLTSPEITPTMDSTSQDEDGMS